MAKRLPVPPELESLIEKREQETDRRKRQRRSAADAKSSPPVRKLEQPAHESLRQRRTTPVHRPSPKETPQTRLKRDVSSQSLDWIPTTYLCPVSWPPALRPLDLTERRRFTDRMDRRGAQYPISKRVG